MSELTEDQKLVKLGLRSPNQTQSAVAEIIAEFQARIAQDWDTFQENFDDANLGSFDDFETWLTNNGFSLSEAEAIRNAFESKYSSWSAFSDKMLNEYTSWADFKNDFASNPGLRSDRETKTGLSAAGIKVYEEAGVGRSGQTIPAGGVEVYGTEVHFSESTAVRDTKDDSSGSNDPIVWSNLSVSPTGVRVDNIVDVEADVKNNTNYVGNVAAELIVDGILKQTKIEQLSGGQKKTVSFEYRAGDDGTGTFQVGISKAGTKQVQVIYGGL